MSRARSRSPYMSRSRSRSPRCSARRSWVRSRRPPMSPRRRGGSPSPISSRSSRLSSCNVSRAPSNSSKPSVILQYYGVKVMNLPDDFSVKEAQLVIQNRFKDYGFIISTVVSDGKEGRFAVVMYNSADGQAKAVETGAEPLLGKHLQVIALTSEITRNCYSVKVTCPTQSLDKHVLNAIFCLFKIYGSVVSIKLYDGQKGRFVVLKFERQLEHTKALEANGKFVLGHAIKVTALKARHSKHKALDHISKKGRSKQHVDTKCNLRTLNDTSKFQSAVKNDESPSGLSEEMDRCQFRESRMLFVSNLDTNITKQELLNTFGHFGEIVDIYINSLPGSARQFAFLQFSLTPSVTSAIQSMNGAFLGRCQITLDYGVVQPSKCVCVEGLSSSLTNEYLIQRFGEYGTIEKLLYDKTRRSALILYTEEHVAQKAVDATRSLKVTGERLLMDYANDSFQLHYCRSVLASQGLHTGKT